MPASLCRENGSTFRSEYRSRSYYTHLVLWNKEDKRIAGAYRLAWSQDILRHKGTRGHYTPTLFHFSPAFFARLGPAVELGRSFVRTEYQKDAAPLLLLWQRIAACIAARPNAPVLFGAVSISASYSDAARKMMVEYLRHNRWHRDLADRVRPVQPFRSCLNREFELRLLTNTFRNLDDPNRQIRDIDAQAGVPALIRQYVKLGGQVAAFNVDRGFSKALDALLLVNLRDTPQRLLSRYMGLESARKFLSHFAMGRPA